VIVLIDYGMGNLRSVQKAFELKGARPKISSDPTDVERAEKIVLPGVGAFDHALRELENRKLIPALKGKIKSGAPFLGLCLGLQLLFESSEESADGKKTQGLGIIPGAVRRFRGDFKIPHMGWNTVEFKKKDCPLFKKIPNGEYFYFVHSYYAVPKDSAWSASTTRYGVNFCSSVWKDNVFATQFHPEKSQSIGLRMIENFVKL
jgi:glutamine amidotransferase